MSMIELLQFGDFDDDQPQTVFVNPVHVVAIAIDSGITQVELTTGRMVSVVETRETVHELWQAAMFGPDDDDDDPDILPFPGVDLSEIDDAS